MRDGWEVQMMTVSGNCTLLEDSWKRLGLGIHDPNTPNHFDFVACNCAQKTLEKRSKDLSFKELRVPGSPYGRRTLVEECMELYPEAETPKAPLRELVTQEGNRVTVIGTGVGNHKDADKKEWARWAECLHYWNGEKVTLGDKKAKPVTGAKNLIGKTSLNEAIQILGNAKVYVGVDNGLGHLAAAVGCKTVTVFTNTSPRFRPAREAVYIDMQSGGRLEDVINGVHLALTAGQRTPVEVSENRLLSVVITAHNEGAEVLLTVEDVLQHAGCPVEVIVVDDSSTDGSCDNLPEGVKLVHNDGKRSGVAPSRNLGAAEATGEAILFLDAHMRVRPGAPALLMQLALEHRAVVTSCMGALYRDRGANGHARYRMESGYVKAKWTGQRPKESLEPTTAWVAPGWVIPTQIFSTIGPWPSLMRNWGSTEIAMSVAANVAGIPIYTSREAVVWHRFRDKFPYSGVTTKIVRRNAYVIARGIIDSDDLVNRMKKKFWSRDYADMLDSDEMRELRAKWSKLRMVEWPEFEERFIDYPGDRESEKPIDRIQSLIAFFTSSSSQIFEICETCTKYKKCSGTCTHISRRVSHMDQCPLRKWYRKIDV
jgi:glycosyltransferase involved in cell wall biosynthesis